MHFQVDLLEIILYISLCFCWPWMSPPLDDHKVPFDVVNSWYEFPLHKHRPYAFNNLLCFNDRIFFNQVKLRWIALFIDYFFFCDAVSSLSMWMFLDLDCKLISCWILNWDMSRSFISLRIRKLRYVSLCSCELQPECSIKSYIQQ